MDVFDAAERYKQDGRPLIVLAGKEYGSGMYCVGYSTGMLSFLFFRFQQRLGCEGSMAIGMCSQTLYHW